MIVNQKDLYDYCVDMVKRINKANADKREELFNSFSKEISFLDGIDYKEYKDGYVTNSYINFDSYCGLSFITASADMSLLLEYGKPKDLSEACSLLSEIGERREYWDDLIDGDTFTFEYDPEYVADSIASVLDDWVGEEEFEKELTQL